MDRFRISILLAILGLGLIAMEIENAPEGYEDATGFHFGRLQSD